VGGELTRRSLLRHGGLLGAATVLAQLPGLLDARGLLATAAAQSADLTEDTMSGLVAFVLPGSDAYSVAQGESFDGPGGIAAGAAPALIAGLDRFVSIATVAGPDLGVPISAAVATLLNQYALRVNPLAAGGGFPSPFARLSFGEKARVFELFDSDPANEGTELRFLAGILCGLTALYAFSEAGVWDPQRRELTGGPVGWDIAGYGGPAEGHAELKGYYGGFRSAIDA
jgi:hypothetical protein